MSTQNRIGDTAAPNAPVKVKKSRKKLILGAAMGAAILFAFAIGNASGGNSTAASTAAAPVAAPVTVTAEAPAPVTVTAPAPAPITVTAAPAAPIAPAAPAGPLTEITKSGTFIVGKDIAAGEWVSDGKISPSKSVGYFAVLVNPKADKNDIDNVVTNDNPEGQAFVTLTEGQGFNTENLHWTISS